MAIEISRTIRLEDMKGVVRALRRKARRIKRACTVKKRFATEEEAWTKFAELRAKNAILPSGYVYDCCYCHGFHMTNGRKYYGPRSRSQ
jgi:hypothetical protein